MYRKHIYLAVAAFVFVAAVLVYLSYSNHKTTPENYSHKHHAAPTPDPGDSESIYLAPDGNNIYDMAQGDEGLFMPRGFAELQKMRLTVTKNQFASMMNYGKMFLGRSYVYGSKRYENSSFDCSDLVHAVILGGLGADIKALDSRTQDAYIKKFGTRTYTDIKQARPGDLMFFMSYRGYLASDYKGIDKSKETVTHVGIYTGNNQLFHAASAPTGVRYQDMTGHLQWRFLRGGSLW